MSVIPIDVTEVSESPEIWPRWHTDRTSADLGDLGRPGYELGPGRGELAGDSPKLAEMTLKFADPSVVDLRPRDRPGRNLGRSAFLGGTLGFPGLDRRIQIWSTFAALQCDVIKFAR